jgi:hypothetical protein
MSPATLLAFLQQHRLAVQASVSDVDAPQAAVVGIAVTDRFEIVFDTLEFTRKVRNLRIHPGIALVIGGLNHGDERTAQYEGIADEPKGAELERLQSAYFHVYPECRAHLTWPGITYVRVRPTWIRYSDYNVNPPLIVEFRSSDLSA